MVFQNIIEIWGGVMRFYKNLVVGSRIENVNKVKRMLKKCIAVYDVHCICVRSDAKNLMEIIPATQILKQPYTELDYLIIGLASDKKEAFSLVASILETHIQKGGGLATLKKMYSE